MNLAEQNKRPINIKKFFKLGFVTTIYQLIIVSIMFTIIFYLNVGLLILGILFLFISVFYILYKIGSEQFSQKIRLFFQNIVNKIIGWFKIVLKNITRIKNALPEVLHVAMFYNNGIVFQTTLEQEINIPKLGENLAEVLSHIKKL